jgi:hypothetical protein
VRADLLAAPPLLLHLQSSRYNARSQGMGLVQRGIARDVGV